MNKLGDEKFNQEFVVIDTETTGFGKTDRIIEIACVVFSGNQIIEEYSTLINPNRDVGKTQIHGIRPSMVTSAPLFSEIAIDILRILQNRVIVAHNLAFDLRMLKQEFEKIQIDFNAGRGVCTMTEVSRIYSAQNSSLHKACEIFEIQQHDMHHALGDARATFELFQALNPNLKNVDVVSNSFDKSKIPSRTLTRKAFEPQELVSISKIQSITKKVPFPSSEERFISYFQVLNLVLEDLVISTDEMIELRNWSEQLNISNKELEKLHSDYLDSFVQATLRDGVVTLDEMEMLTKIANSLNLPLELPEAAQEIKPNNLNLTVGLKVCFTGSAIGPNGKEISRSDLEALASKVGLYPVADVTKKGCDLVVAADERTMSGKGKKAKDWGIQIISVEKFITFCTFG
jgi:DNA polymerase-3 subunit epsilon